MKLIVSILTVVLIISFVQHLGINVFLSTFERENFKVLGGLFRSPSVFSHPNINAFFLILFGYSILSYRVKILSKHILFFILFVFFIFLITGTRGVIFISLLSLLFYRIKLTVKLVTVLLFILLIFSYYSFDIGKLQSMFRMSSSIYESSSFFLRVQLWLNALELFLERPFQGYGYRGFEMFSSVYIWGNYGFGTEEYKTHANSFWLENLVDRGFLFTLSLFGLIIFSFLKSKLPTFYPTIIYVLVVLSYDDFLHDPISFFLFEVFLIIMMTRKFNLHQHR